MAAAAPIQACSPDPLAFRGGAQPGAAPSPPPKVMFENLEFWVAAVLGGHDDVMAMRASRPQNGADADSTS